MALSITVEVSKGLMEAPLEVQRRASALKGARLNTVIGHEVARLFKDHLFKRDFTHANHLGGTRTHFYSDAAKATSSQGTDEEAIVTVAQQGIRQRLEGGTIRPQNGKYLTIPARAEAYGRRAREFANLKFVPLGNGRGMLVANDAKEKSAGSKRKFIGKQEGGLAYYWLVPSVTQAEDPTVLPSEGVIRGVVAGVVEMAWNRDARRPS